MIRWGFLGAGFIATQALAPAVHAAAGATLHAVAARSLERAGALHPQVAYDDYAALLADPQVDAVYLSLTNEQHLPWAVAAMQAGKAVLCEKPLALTAHEGRQLAHVAATTGQLLVEASWYRWHPRVLLAQQKLAQIAPVRHVSAGFTFAGDLAGNYRLEPARGGGALYDVGCYAVSACLWAIDRGLPAVVTARSDIGPTGVDLQTRVLLEWEGASAEVHASIASEQGQWLVLTGDRGQIDLPGAPFTSWRGDDTQLWVSDGRDTERIEVPAVDAYQLMVENFGTVLAGRAGWVLPVADSVACAAVLDAARRSAASGQPVTLG